MKDINWKENYPEMPEEFHKVILDSVKRQINDYDNVVYLHKKHRKQHTKWVKAASIVVSCLMVLSLSGFVIAKEYKVSFGDIVNILFDNNRENLWMKDEEIIRNIEEEKEVTEDSGKSNLESAENKRVYNFDITEYGKELQETYSCDEYEIQLTGVVTDGYGGMVFYDVIRNEAYRNPAVWNECLPYIYIENEEIEDHYDIISSEGNVYHMYARFGNNGESLYGKTIQFNLNRESGVDLSDGENVKNRVCNVETTIQLPEERADSNIRVALNEEADMGLFGNYYIEEAVITPLQICFIIAQSSSSESCMKWKENKGDDNGKAMITFTDGTTKDVGHVDTMDKVVSVIWDYPLNPKEIAEIQIGEYHVKFSDVKN